MLEVVDSIDPGTGAEVIQLSGIGEHGIRLEKWIPSWFLNKVMHRCGPFNERIVYLLKAVKVWRGSKDALPDVWTSIRDVNGAEWMVSVPEDIRKEWRKGPLERSGWFAAVAADLMLGTRGLGTLGINVRNDDCFPGKEIGEDLSHYFLCKRTDDGWVEEDYSTFKVIPGDRPLNTMLALFSMIPGTLKARRCVVMNGTTYGKTSTYKYGPLTLASNELPELTINTSGEDLADKYIRPVLGNRRYDALCMALCYATIIDWPEGGLDGVFFVIRGDGVNDGSILLDSYADRFPGTVGMPRIGKLAQNIRVSGPTYNKIRHRKVQVVKNIDKLTDRSEYALRRLVRQFSELMPVGNGDWDDVPVRCISILLSNDPTVASEKYWGDKLRVEIDLRSTNGKGWSKPLTDEDEAMAGLSTGATVRDYAKIGRCIDEMIVHGMSLILKKQNTAGSIY